MARRGRDPDGGPHLAVDLRPGLAGGPCRHVPGRGGRRQPALPRRRGGGSAGAGRRAHPVPRRHPGRGGRGARLRGAARRLAGAARAAAGVRGTRAGVEDGRPGRVADVRRVPGQRRQLRLGLGQRVALDRARRPGRPRPLRGAAGREPRRPAGAAAPQRPRHLRAGRPLGRPERADARGGTCPDHRADRRDRGALPRPRPAAAGRLPRGGGLSRTADRLQHRLLRAERLLGVAVTVEEAGPGAADAADPDPDDLHSAAGKLVAGLVHHPWGRTSPSVYETGRLVSLAPWLTGHSARIRFLLDTQRADGGWGPPDPGYALVPTLSAAEALLSALGAPGHRRPAGLSVAEVVRGAGRALRTLARRLDGATAAGFPDMPAIEHITPALIEAINGHLDRLRDDPALTAWWTGGRLAPPAGMDGAFIAAAKAHLENGGAVPLKVQHALEVAGTSARRAGAVHPAPLAPPGPGAPGRFATVGASTAATAAWLGGPDGDGAGGDAALRYLEAAVEQHGGPVPVAVPVTNFERGWVLGWLARSGLAPDVPPELVAQMRASLGEDGAPGGTGLPPDADTSSGVLYALSLLGEPHPPDLLWEYETGTHFCSWPGENGRSVTTNAHVLEAFGHYLECGGAGPSDRYAASARKAASWLIGEQLNDGRWQDRWHASPLYATACAALALNEFGGPESAGAVNRAVEWVLREQRPDGSWGRWCGTAEETAYAVHVLTLARPSGGAASGPAARERAVRRGGAYLSAALRKAPGALTGGPEDVDSGKPPLWHDKDLYRPTTIVHAAVLGALRLVRHDARVSAR
ncbi:prenyltransferase [Actinomadura sp. DSM 109109]|nr:prenyltransferase [Actinomadura lepetitiana]